MTAFLDFIMELEELCNLLEESRKTGKSIYYLSMGKYKEEYVIKKLLEYVRLKLKEDQSGVSISRGDLDVREREV